MLSYPPASIIKTAVFAWANEVYKGLLISWHYKFNLLMEFLQLAVNFLGMCLLLTYGNMSLQEFGPLLLGYIIWVYASYILEANYTFTLEGRSGTLEQLYMSPAPQIAIYLGALSATIISSSIMIVLMYLIFAAIFNIYIPFTLSALPILLITLLGVVGFGLAIAGAALTYKNVNGFTNLLSYLLLYMNGSMLPTKQFPFWLSKIAYLLPTTQGIELLRKIVFENYTLIGMIKMGDLQALTLNAVAYCIIGFIMFNYCEQKARSSGNLGNY